MKEIRLKKYINDEKAYNNIITIYKALKSNGDIQLITYFKFLIWASLNVPKDSKTHWMTPIEFGKTITIPKINKYYDFARKHGDTKAFSFDKTRLK